MLVVVLGMVLGSVKRGMIEVVDGEGRGCCDKVVDGVCWSTGEILRRSTTTGIKTR